MNGKEVQNLSVKERKAMGLGYIPSDRHKDAMVPDFSITENFLLGYQEDPKYCKKGFIDYKALEEDAKVQVEQFEIKIAGVSQHIGQLSGGNQQKVILGMIRPLCWLHSRYVVWISVLLSVSTKHCFS
jgi:ABC-type uncharacterized transport system ATPase subunit